MGKGWPMALVSLDQAHAPIEGPRLPDPRGSLTECLLDRLTRPVHDLGSLAEPDDDPIVGEDAPLALYLCYEQHYRGLPGVDEGWEWEPSLLAVRRQLERSMERRLTEMAGRIPCGKTAAEVVGALRQLAADDTGPSLSEVVEREASTQQVRELAIHRSAYQLKEADPHTWGIPRLLGEAKAAMVQIQTGEYGDGVASDVHATLYATTMEALGLDPTYGAYLDVIPGVTLSTCNLISLFGLHRTWRAALVGHLALFEMSSVEPMRRYSAGMSRLGYGPEARRFYDDHVLADEVHQRIALEMVAGLIDDEPFTGGEVIFGARALRAVEAAMATRILDAWAAGECSLRRPPRLASTP
jgi:hypothetical protein